MSVNFSDHPLFRNGSPFRAEIDLYDCEVDGELPSGFNGSFYRVGPDFRYPPRYDHEVPFNGDGHISMFRFYDGNVDFRSRYAETQRYLAEKEAREALYGVYRNRYTDKPEVRDLSGGTANTHVVFYNGKLLALKEDSPPVAMDPHSLATVDNYFTFDDQLTSLTFTAHPKFDYERGEMIAFGYEAKGEATRDVAVFSFDMQGNKTWEAWIKVPYTCMLHDFAVSRDYVGFLVIPYVTSVERMKEGQVHWAWDQTKPSYLGVMRRDGDGSDVEWLKAPTRCATHVMGSWSDGNMFYIDMDMGRHAQFPFFPFLHDEQFNPKLAAGRLTRLSVDMASSTKQYNEEVMFEQFVGALPRQDDRYNGEPYRYGIMPCGGYGAGRPSIVMFDHAKGTTQSYVPPEGTSIQEPCFAPRSEDAPEGDGYILAMVSRQPEGGRNDFIILDTDDLSAGPVATVRLPFAGMGQIHGWWVPDWQLEPGMLT